MQSSQPISLDPTPQQQRIAKRNRTKKIERILALFAIISLIVAWFVGYSLQGSNIAEALPQAAPQADRFDKVSADSYAIYEGDQIVGYISIGEADGYGGPMDIAVAVDLEGIVTGIGVVSHKETPSYFDRVMNSKLVSELIGKPYSAAFVLGEDINGVTGATYTSRALADSVLEGSQIVAGEQLGLPVTPPEPPAIQFGIPEITLILLYAAWFVVRRPKFKYKKQLRWGMLLVGLIVLGFWFNVPLTLSKINMFLLGYFPQWQTNLYWYMLILGLVFFFTVENKNAYCSTFCPFGAAQECMGVIGGAKYDIPRNYRRTMVWVVRGLAWLAILFAFLFRNPGLTSYEVFGTLFSLTGSAVMFALLGIILLTSLIVRRPWCSYLCPLDPVYDIIRLARGWVLELWQKTRQKVAAPSS